MNHRVQAVSRIQTNAICIYWIEFASPLTSDKIKMLIKNPVAITLLHDILLKMEMTETNETNNQLR